MSAETPKPVKKDIWYMCVAAMGTVRPAAERQCEFSANQAVDMRMAASLAPANPTTLIKIPAMYAAYALFTVVHEYYEKSNSAWHVPEVDAVCIPVPTFPIETVQVLNSVLSPAYKPVLRDLRLRRQRRHCQLPLEHRFLWKNWR